MTSSVIETIETQAHRIVNYKDGILRVYSKPSHIELDDVMALLDTFAKLHDDDSWS